MLDLPLLPADTIDKYLVRGAHGRYGSGAHQPERAAAPGEHYHSQPGRDR
ncbi:hypothetical protein ACFL34_04925 [Candidatus Sumerlaeota bacterium]